MKPVEVVAQCIGIVAMLFNILSYQSKNQKTLIALQLFGSALFSLNYLLLGATVGGILNILSAVRAIVFLFKDRLKADKTAWFVAFIVSYVLVYILSFTVFGKEPTAFNLIIEILPVIAMLLITIGYRLKNAAAVRRCALISSPAWLTYNIAVFSLGGIICEIFTLISILVGILRHDKKAKD